MEYPCRDSSSPLRGSVGMTFAFNVYSRTLIINPNASTKAGCIIVAARFIAREKRFIARTLLSRQGWERLCGEGGEDAFPSGGGDRRKPHARAGAGKRRRSPRKKQRAGKPHLSGQPDGAT